MSSVSGSGSEDEQQDEQQEAVQPQSQAEQGEIDQTIDIAGQFSSSEQNAIEKSESQIEQLPVKKCDNCSVVESLSRCAGCKSVYYCSAQCQQAKWAVHKIDCKRVQQQLKEEEAKRQEEATRAAKAARKSLDHFSGLKWIGQGNFSEIFAAVEVASGQRCAIKQINKRRLSQVNKEKDVIMEKHCLSKLKENPYCIRIYSTFQDDDNLYFQMELVEGGELWKHIYLVGLIAQSLIKYYFALLVQALESFHAMGIVHRDIKSENVLLTPEHTIKFIDFGTARDLQNPQIQGSGNGLKGKRNFQHFVGTPQFMAPECIRNKDSNEKSDVYSLGCLFYQMIAGNPPFEGASEYLIFTKTLEQQVAFPEEWIFSDEERDLITKMLTKPIEDRISLQQVKEHAYWGPGWDWNNLPSYEQARAQMSELESFLEQTKQQLQLVEAIETNTAKQARINEIIAGKRAQIEQLESSEGYEAKLKYIQAKAVKLLNEDEHEQPQVTEQFPPN